MKEGQQEPAKFNKFPPISNRLVLSRWPAVSWPSLYSTRVSSQVYSPLLHILHRFILKFIHLSCTSCTGLFSGLFTCLRKHVINTIWYDLASQARTREGGTQLLVFDNLSLAGIASLPASRPASEPASPVRQEGPKNRGTPSKTRQAHTTAVPFGFLVGFR